MTTGELLQLLLPLMLLLGVVVFGARFVVRRQRNSQLCHARKLFSLRREWLETEFLKRAAQSGKPRGLEWTNCDFADQVTFARDRNSRQLRALVATTISFQAIDGGGMEEVAAVGNLRSATAVFYYRAAKWETDGRAIFNLDPMETIRHFHHELERV